ncbi:MAG TPA: YkgJ family cysteine cluster protein [Polyangiaceae bacterium]|nr:YkgJ family cysteine cluster protein [Polyangiaceae bacterium]
MTEFQRKAEKSYTDPVSQIWIRAAELYGLRVVRTDDAYASYDGKGTLLIAKDVHLDPDDSLAQMILHELCHAAVAGAGAKQELDWGLSNEDGRDLVSEQACHRLQAYLARRHGLRQFFAVTTDHRPYWDALPIDPLAPEDDPAVTRARSALQFVRSTELGRILDDALTATRAIAQIAKRHAPSRSLWSTVTPLHASGFPLHEDANVHCGECAWHFTAGKKKPVQRCRQTRSGGRSAVSIESDAQGCERFEAKFDEGECASCGACCREGFHLVMVGKNEAITKRHLDLLVPDGRGFHVPRPGGVCVALKGTGSRGAPYRCSLYAVRPRSCRDFAVQSDACLTARRRVALSR